MSDGYSREDMDIDTAIIEILIESGKVDEFIEFERDESEAWWNN